VGLCDVLLISWCHTCSRQRSERSLSVGAKLLRAGSKEEQIFTIFTTQISKTVRRMLHCRLFSNSSLWHQTVYFVTIFSIEQHLSRRLVKLKLVLVWTRLWKIIHAFITARLDCCNALNVGFHLTPSVCPKCCCSSVDWDAQTWAHFPDSVLPSLAPCAIQSWF